MFKILAFFMLFLTLLGGFIMSNGNIKLLWHPNELLMIFGPALSCFVIANPWSVVKSTGRQLLTFFKDDYSKDFYKEALLLMFYLTKLYKKSGNLELEKHTENPEESEIFKKFPKILKNKASINFICENLSFVTNGNYKSHDVESYLDAEIDTYVAEAELPAKALDSLAEMLPSLGIVVAVAGIIISMQYIDSSASVFAEKISAALFGTFIGVFAAYAIVFPISNSLHNKTKKFKHFLDVLKSNTLSFIHGHSPYISVEIARKNVPPSLRISHKSLEEAIQNDANN